MARFAAACCRHETEVTGGEQTQQQHADADRDDVNSGMQIEIADPADQQIGHGQVEKPPQHIDR
jgi:hypothetical protein